ncbi:MAG: spore coat protein [Clostridiales bacterium]|nr:spore coat protein [Clostridiales bacterium]
MNTTYSDKEKIADALMTQKFVTGNYNSFANECAHPEVKRLALELLSDEHAIQHEIFTEMQNHGWYEVKAATEAAIQQAKTQLENSCC